VSGRCGISVQPVRALEWLFPVDTWYPTADARRLSRLPQGYMRITDRHSSALQDTYTVYINTSPPPRLKSQSPWTSRSDRPSPLAYDGGRSAGRLTQVLYEEGNGNMLAG